MSEHDSILAARILDAVNAGLVVLDRDGRILRWNSWMTRASRHGAQDVVGKPISAIFPESDLRLLNAAVVSAVESGTPAILTHALHPMLLPLWTGAGHELLHDITVSAIYGPASVLCLMHVADVTLATRRELYLRERQNARYNAVVAGAPDVILTLDGDGIIRLANPASMQFGYEPEELIGRDASLLFETGTSWREIWERAVAGESADRSTEIAARRKDGSASFFEVSASRWQSDSRLFVTAILRDINERRDTEIALRLSEELSRAAAEALTELNATLEQRVSDRTAELMRAEEALRQSHKMEAIGQLTGGIAHDFNNLLQGIIGGLNVVERRVNDGRISDIPRFLQGALESAHRASALTHRLLAFSRRQPVDPRPVQCNDLIGNVQELLRRSIGEKLEMSMALADDLWLVRCDANQLENALLNLAINARDAMPQGGTLTVRTFNTSLGLEEARAKDVGAGDYVCLEVTDTGTGMPPDVQSRVFEPFYTTKPIGQGTGLGLSMIYGFVRQSEGAITIRSAPDEGTSIAIFMPRFSGEPMPEPIATGVVDDPFVERDDVVLVVEDDAVVRLVVVEVLHDEGYSPLEAADGAAALRILQSPQRVDLLVTDVGLPDINGRQLADAGRTKRPGLKVLFMTGYAEKAAASTFLDEGMEILTKPFLMEELADKIRGMLDP